MRTGIDVSRHQGAVDWSRVAAAGHTFAFIKATDGIVKDGRMWVDPFWTRNRDQARAAGLQVGGYHYARPSTNTPEAEAEHFARHLGATDLAPVFDIEDPDATSGVGDWSARFLARLEALTGQVPIVYTYPAYWRSKVGNDSRFARYPLWIARYRDAEPEPLPPWTTWTYWQHTSSGTCPGVAGRVDLNRMKDMPMSQQFIATAASELGYTETPAGSNRTKFAAEADHINGYPWCATFIVAIARRCGITLPSESAYTPSMANAFKTTGRWHATPEPGDIAFFDFPDSKKRIQHVGIVESVRRNGSKWDGDPAYYDAVTCIEGNTSAGTAGSQDNGGGVYRRTRPRTHVVGYGRPHFTEGDDDLNADQNRWLMDIHHQLTNPQSDLNKQLNLILHGAEAFGVEGTPVAVSRTRRLLEKVAAKLGVKE